MIRTTTSETKEDSFIQIGKYGKSGKRESTKFNVLKGIAYKDLIAAVKEMVDKLIAVSLN